MSDIKAGDTCARCGKVVRNVYVETAGIDTTVTAKVPHLSCDCLEGPTSEGDVVDERDG